MTRQSLGAVLAPVPRFTAVLGERPQAGVSLAPGVPIPGPPGPPGADGAPGPPGATGATGPAGPTTHTVCVSIDGGGAAIPAGDLGLFLPVNYSGTITGASIAADQAGSIAIDVWKRAAAIPTAAHKISAGAPVALAGAQLNEAVSVSGWSVAVSTGDVFGFHVVSAAALITRVNVQIYIG